MGQLHYQEIFYTSSEKGIFGGNAGFGVRTCTIGMDSIDVYKIVDSCATGYAVYNERVLDMDRILSNPNIVYDYPPVYLFRIVDLNDGSRKYVFGRTVYIGVDYGFFKGINAYDRTGTNYITHLMVINEDPSTAIIRNLLINSMYLPCNYTCSPNNIELKELLTGEPEYLSMKSIENDETLILEEDALDLAPFIKGIVQMLRNRQFSPEFDVPIKMYVKCPWHNVEACLKVLNIFPNEYLENLQYLTNYMQGYGIPDGYDIVFVNEFNETELYEDNYINVDLFTGTNKNVSNNIFLTNIGVFVRQHNAASAAKLIRYYLNLKDVQETEYELYYNIFLGTMSDLDIKLIDLTEQTIQKISSIQLDQSQNKMFWGKINKALNNGLTSKQGRDFLLAVDKIKLLKKYYTDKILIQEESINYVTNILFSGRGNFGKIANGENISILLQLVNKNLIPSEELFLTSLRESPCEIVWADSLSFFYNDHYVGNNKILLAILNSSLSESAMGRLISSLFPLPQAADSLFDFFKNNPSSIEQARSTISSLINYYGEKRFSDFVWLGYLSPVLTQLLVPIISSHYKEEVESNVKSGTNALFVFLENVGTDQLTRLDLWSVLKAATKLYLNESIRDIKLYLSKLNNMNVPYREFIPNEILILTNLIDQEVPLSVDIQFMEAVIKNYPNGNQYITSVFSAWMTSGVMKDELKSFIVKNKIKITDSLIDYFVKTIWNHESSNVRNSRETLVLAIIDNCGWDSIKINEYGQQCENVELKGFLLKNNKLIAKITRRLFR